MHVHIEEAGRARAKHLKASELSTYIDIMCSHLLFDRPYIVLQPRHQGQVITVATEERHRRMGMRIDEAWDDGLVGAVKHLRSFRSGEAWGNTGDYISLDEDVGSRRPVEDILY